MPILLKLWLTWMTLSLIIGVLSIAANDVGDYPTTHWTFTLNGYALGSFVIGVCTAVLVALIWLVWYNP